MGRLVYNLEKAGLNGSTVHICSHLAAADAAAAGEDANLGRGH